MARPHKFFKNLKKAQDAARKRGHLLWKFVHTGYLKTGYFVGEKLPQKILVTSALVTQIVFSRRQIRGKPEKPW